MLAYIFDGTIDGIFTCVFRSFTKKENPAFITDDAIQCGIFDETVCVKTDYEANKRIIAAIYKYGGFNALNDVKFAFRNGSKNTPTVIFEYIKKTFEARKNISGKFSDETVLAFYDLIKRVSFELHRFKGFLRFNESVEGIYYARFEPDNDIADLLLPHFKARLGNTPFAIHDAKRNVAALCNGKNTKIVKTEVSFVEVTENESSVGALWREYYNAVNIPTRKNEKLMRAFMPARYYKNLTEKTTARAN